MGKTIDIIIPMYNRAHCVSNLKKCLMAQTMQDYRVIFVDDGSTDNTLNVLDTELKDAPFPYLVIHQENKGAGAARNTGLRASDAPWSVFIDSDDTILPEYLEYLYTAATENDADFAYCDFKMVPEGSVDQIPAAGALDVQVVTSAECMSIHYNHWLSNACLIMNSQVRRREGVYYDEACSYTEDNNFMTDLILASNKVAKVNNVLYLYHIYQGSRSRSPSIDKFMSGVDSFKRMEAKVDKLDTETAKVFRSMAPARYYLATYRKAAVQMKYIDFRKLAELIPMKPYRAQLAALPLQQRIAGLVLLTSKPLFYGMIHLLFKD